MANMIIFTLVIAGILAFIGYRMLSGQKKEIELRQQARGWPKTIGIVTGAEIKETRQSMTTFGKGFLPRRQSLNLYTPVIHYQYRVNDTTYQSSKYKNGRIAQSGEWSSLIPQNVEKILADHPQNKAVTVFYNPEDPAQAYLDLDTSVNVQRTYRAGGFILIAAAALLLVLGCVRVGQGVVAQKAVENIPVAIPFALEEIQKNLASDLNVSSCQKDAKSAHAEKISYTIWICTFTGQGGTSRILIYSREDDLQKVDRVVAFKGELQQESVLDFYKKLSQAVAQSTGPSQVNQWLEETLPVVSQDQNKVDTEFSGIKFSLDNENGLGTSLEVGVLQ